MSDFIAGACVGLTQVSIGHPFDTAMVLMQNNKKWFGLPFKNYYRGWRFPLVSATLFNCTVFPCYERSLKYTDNKVLSGAIAGMCIAPILYGFEIGKDKGFHPLIAGGMAGLANWGLTYPLDVIKSRQIAQGVSIKEALKLGNLYKGFSVCGTRAVLVNAANFWMYETVKEYLNPENDE